LFHDLLNGLSYVSWCNAMGKIICDLFFASPVSFVNSSLHAFGHCISVKKQMEKAARDLDFMEAARLRDEMFKMQKELEGMKS